METLGEDSMLEETLGEDSMLETTIGTGLSTI